MNEDFKFIILTTSDGEIAVNIDQVNYIKKYGEQSLLTFSNEMTKVVKETYEEVISCLRTIKPSEIS